MSTAPEENWDFYLCKVDDNPASIFVNLALWDYSEDAPEDTLYALLIDMADPGDHGMGTAEEAQARYPIEDVIEREALALGVRYVGRLRNNGIWQMTFMGPADCEEALSQVASAALAPVGGTFEGQSRHDPEWSYFRDFLFPDDHIMQWMKDRAVVEALKEHGDPLTAPRRVDHWLYFPNAFARAQFAEAVQKIGFETEELEPADDGTVGLQIHRVDSVQLEEINEVTSTLKEMAVDHEAEYDGWETSVEKEE